ncbi:MAG: trypsin-like peptidase domain-containing protein, partial [Opitutales bacterium]
MLHRFTANICSLALLSLATLAQADDGDSLDDTIQRSVAKVYPAIVRIHVVAENGSGGRMKKSRGSGSGVIISKEGHVVTNHHVAGRAIRLTCRLNDGQELEATLVGTDILTDLSVLRLRLDQRTGDSPLPTAKFGDSEKIKVGDVVLAMGSPAGLSQSVTRGIASNLAMIPPGSQTFRLDGENVGMLVRWIGHDAIIFPGNSGGPLVNLKGEIIGINEVGIGSLGGAIPGNLAWNVAQQLIEH